MSKEKTGLMILFFVACVCVFIQRVSALPATTYIVSALILISTITAIVLQPGRRRVRRFARRAAPALLILLSPALSWATFPTSFQNVVTSLPTGSTSLGNPQDVAVDNLGNVYVADSTHNQVIEITAAGVASVVTFPGLSPALHTPTAVALDGSGNLYVADSNNSRIVELAGGVASVINTGALLSYPDGVAIDASGNLYIADAVNNDVVLVPAGGTAAVFVISGLGTALNSPGNVAVDVAGNLYIADAGNNRIVEVTPGGVGSVLSIVGGITLNTPLGVAVDRVGNVYIADRQNSRIVTVSAGGVADVLRTGAVELQEPEGVAVDIAGNVYIADSGNVQVEEVEPSAVNFGHSQLAVSSGTTITLPFTIGFLVTYGSVQALTLGTPNLDFTVSATTCVSGTTTNGACTVDITFLPTAPGLRRGAVVIYDNSSPPVLLLTVPLYGISDAPLAALSPGNANVVNTGGIATLLPFQLAFDGAGDIYVGDYDGMNVLKVPAGGGTGTVVNTGGLITNFVTGVVLDGAGNLFIGDHINSRIVVVTNGGVASVLTINGLGTGLAEPTALAMDLAGNLYIADWNNGRVVEVSSLVVGTSSSGYGTVLGTGSYPIGASSDTGIAVDALGTVYVADRTNNRVIKVTAAGVASLLVPAGVTPVLSDPQGVAVDGFGNVYIADSGNNRIVQVTSAGVASVVPIVGLPAPATLGSPFGVSVDPSGNLFIPDWTNNRVVNVNVTASALSFPNTKVGLASSSKTATLTNLGDLALVFAADPTYTADFSQPTGASNQCLSSTSLSAGTICELSVQFTPQSVGVLSATILATNNNLNVSNATQSVAVNGTGLNPGDATAVAVSTNPATANIAQPLTITAVVTDTTAGHTATILTGGVTFTDTVGSTVVLLNGGSPVTLLAGVAALPGVTLSGAGLHTITANYVGVSGSFLPSSNTATLTVTKTPVVVAGPVSQPVQVVNGQAGSVPVTVTGPYSGLAVPSGSVNYNVLNSSNTSVATGSATLTAGTTNATTTVPITNSLFSGSYTVSLSYGGDGNYAASSTATTVQVAVGLTVPTISWTPLTTAITYGITLNGLLNASAANGSTSVAGSFVYTATPQGGSAIVVTGATVLGAGIYTLTAAFTPTNTAAYASANASISLSVAQAMPAVTLTSSGTAVLVTNAVTFTAAVSSPVSMPTGSVGFYDGTTLLGSGTLAQSMATFTTSSLAVGVHSITAVYGGDSNFSPLTSSALTETVTSAYTVTAPSTPVPVAPGGAATINITVPPLGGPFDSAVTLSASGLPPGATATFNPPTVTPGTAGAQTVMTIQLATLAAGIPARRFPASRGGLPIASFSLGFVVFGSVLGRKRFSKTLALIFVLAGLGVTTSLLTGCSGGFANTPQTQPGNYAIVVTGTSGSFHASTTVTLVVQ